MNSRIIILAFILIGICTISTVNADVIDPDKKQVAYYYQIININSYPDYAFLIHGNPSPPYMILNSTEFNFYKLSTVSIYAINKSNFNESALENMNETEQDNYFTNNSQVIPSHLELEGTYGTLNKDNQLEKVLVELEITSLNQTHLEIKKTQAKYFYTFGTTKIADFQDQNTTPPEPSSRGDKLWYFVLPLGALIAILLVLYYRKKEW